jgi:hypothetical protein
MYMSVTVTQTTITSNADGSRTVTATGVGVVNGKCELAKPDGTVLQTVNYQIVNGAFSVTFQPIKTPAPPYRVFAYVSDQRNSDVAVPFPSS